MKSKTFRVTRVREWTSAVAAKNASITPIVLPGSGGFVELEDEHLAVRSECATRGGLGFDEGVVWKKVSDISDEPGGGESFFHVISLKVDIRIDLVREAIVALVFFKADVMCGGANPQGLATESRTALSKCVGDYANARR